MFRESSMMMSTSSANNRRTTNQIHASPLSTSSSMATLNPNSQQTSHRKLATVADFEYKLQESDTYLQLVLDQVKLVDAKITETSNSEVAAALVDIKAKTLTLLDGIKHSIALLQIAKNTVLPVNGILNATSVTPLSVQEINRNTTNTRSSSVVETASLDDAGGVSKQNRTRSPQQHGHDRQEVLNTSATAVHSQQQTTRSQQNLLYPEVVQSRCSASQPNESLIPHDKSRDFSSQSTEVSSPVLTSDSVLIDSFPKKASTNTELEENLTYTDGSDDEDDDCYYDAREPEASHLSLNQSSISTAGANNSRINSSSSTGEGMQSVKSGHMDMLVSSSTGQVPRRGSSGRKSSFSKRPSLGKNLSKEDYDALYEESDEEDLGSLEGHGSVISHLISQVKIGMDLTKVVLPTFILERRSLLEMYADFFAHPDLFVSIADQSTAEGRFIQVVRWYLSAFHAGRKSSVAKKPYNPVVGETFKCHWKIPGEADKGTNTRQANLVASTAMNEHPGRSDTSLHSNDTSCLTFIAEQVSHHPPISAFYAESVDKKITCTAHIYTKSKFLGLSIGVHNIGQGVIRLLERKEDYVVTFPSAYGRSILTVPWIELGGGVTIDCPQTGLHANVEFLTKPFYGGKKNKIACEVFAPNKKQIMCITGEWNGVMTAKWPNGKTEVFVDTRTLPIVKKNVSPISQQEDFESRRLWKELTYHLRTGNVSAATDTKCSIEQRQRDLVKQRQERGEVWQTRAFHAVGDNWFYNHPLTL